ncbi:MAG: 1-acyl-sn-glycerol-3-phosphate acyltransferase [Candidatus Hydrogenedentes bacterium]|nr:1-acyl-sn-glycerol-3-phosphate acyltransferase [Candidatus Hydrogenedentota bacterium]
MMYAKTAVRASVSPLLHYLSCFILKMLGWRLEGERPKETRVVTLAVPHNTNWDLPMALLVAKAMQLPIVFTMKDTLFWWPLSLFWYRIGGIPINRRARTSAVDQMAQAFEEYEHLTLVIPPEGTRKKVKYWRTGFYWIAVKAQVPICMGFVNYEKKFAGLGPVFYPTGDIAADWKIIQAFYEEKLGITPEYQKQESELTAA